MTAIVHNSKTGEQWEQPSLVAAEEFIGQREVVDPEGVFNGDYTIDDMSSPDQG